MSAAFDPFVVQSTAQTEKDQNRQQYTPEKSPIPLHPMQKSAAATEKPGESFGTVSPNHTASLPSNVNRYAHLPTPQSPNNSTLRSVGPPNSPESPMLHAPYPSSRHPPAQTSGHVKFLDGMLVHTPSRSHQIMTPETSPFMQRFENATPQYNPLSDTPTRSSSSPIKMETLTTPYIPSHRTPSPSPSEPHSSHLSSPFMAKATVSSESSKYKNSRSNHRSPANPVFVDDVYSSSNPTGSVAPSVSLISTPPISPPAASVPNSESPTASLSPPPISAVSATNEMDRICQARQQEHDVLESRRPEYLRRTKRTLTEADPLAFVDDENARDRDRLGSVGIMESPVKGRRIKLFQETSEESFEESLMAGGYGRYRTAEWVRQPQPVTLPTPGPAGPSNVIARLEEAEHLPPAPPSEKELKKQKRLAAFRSSNGKASFCKLYPVELEGKGRVLLDIPNNFDEAEIPTTVPKKRNAGGGGKRKKKAEPTAKEKRAMAAAAAAEELIEKPNWPDTEFPWRLRTEEMAEQVKAEEEERLKWIERFLDRDTDEEDDGDGENVGGGMNTNAGLDDDEVIPSSQWGMVYEDEDEHPVPFRAGRGKMVPLAADPDDLPRLQRRRSVYFPSDPADARAALLSKKSVRALSYRRQRRHGEHESEEEILCICRGTDDGRELVQCDACKMWYHLQCIGIRNIAALGREEDPWYCHDCDPGNISEPEQAVAEPYSEPDFAPTEEAPPRVIRPADTAFFQSSLQDSPPQPWSASRIPKTPTRGPGGSSDFGSGFSSSSMSSRLDSSRHGPTTPRHRIHNANIYSTPGPFEVPGYDESPFDPSSTPSRGIKFGAPFATPKNSVFSSRVFHTPLRASTRGVPGSASFGAAGFLSSALSDRGNSDFSPYPRMNGYDDSPVRRTKSTEGPRARRIFEPTASSRVLFEESADSRAKGKEKALDN